MSDAAEPVVVPEPPAAAPPARRRRRTRVRSRSSRSPRWSASTSSPRKSSAGRSTSTITCRSSPASSTSRTSRTPGAAFGLLNAADFPFKAVLMIGIAGDRAGRDCGLRDAAGVPRAARAVRTLAHPRRRVRQPHRSRGRRLRRRLRGRLLGNVPFLGIQRRGRGDHHRGRARAARHDRPRTAACIPFCLRLPGSRSTPTACCWPRRTCSACSSPWFARRARGLDPNRIMDLGIWIIISALVGAKLLLLIVDHDKFSMSGVRDHGPRPIGGRLLRRTDRGGRRGACGTSGGTGCRCGRSRMCSHRASRSAM